MNKAKTLRAALENNFSDFKINPTNLEMIITNRAIIPNQDDLSYRVNYTLNIYLFNQKLDFSAFETCIILWAMQNAPEKLDTAEAREKFQNASIEILDFETYNAEIQIELSELVIVKKSENGELIGNYSPEPPFDDKFIGDNNIKNIGDANIPTFTELDIDIQSLE